MHKLSKAEVMREVKDYIYITLGLISYSLGWAAFLLPYQITTGGTTGIGAIIYYATGFPIQWSYFIINAVLMTFAIRVLGPRFSIKTTYAIFTLTFLLWLFQLVVNNYVEAPDMTPDGKPLLLGTGQDFMACIIGAAMCGVGLGITFNYNGSTGGTDIIAAIVNKYKDVSLGRMIMICDVFIISSCYFIFHDWRRVIFGFVTLFIIGVVLDWICSSRAPLIAFAFCACAAASAARACSIFATTSGASKIASVSPALTLCPSFTRNSNIRPGTLLETRYSVTSACPCMISGPLRSMKKPTTATIAITPSRVRNASSILLFCDFIGAI